VSMLKKLKGSKLSLAQTYKLIQFFRSTSRIPLVFMPKYVAPRTPGERVPLKVETIGIIQTHPFWKC
jgi:hypothetical protein